MSDCYYLYLMTSWKIGVDATLNYYNLSSITQQIIIMGTIILRPDLKLYLTASIQLSSSFIANISHWLIERQWYYKDKAKSVYKWTHFIWKCLY